MIVSGSILPFIITADNIESFITSTISYDSLSLFLTP